MAGADLTVNAVIAQDGDQRRLHIGVMAVTPRPDDALSLSVAPPSGGGPFFLPRPVLALQLTQTDGTAAPEDTMQFASLRIALEAFQDYDQVQVSDGARIAVSDIDKGGARDFPELAGKRLRVVNPGEPVTLDLRFDRLTVFLDAEGRIDRAQIV